MISEKGKKSKKIRNISIVFVVLLAIIPFCLGAFVYESTFNERIETSERRLVQISDFEGLDCEECSFLSKEGLRLTGYKLYNKEFGASFNEAAHNSPAIVIIAQGMGGGGFNPYMSSAYQFTSRGYAVFGYDATGTDNSEGHDMEGIPQGVSDLGKAIEYIENSEEYKNLPIVLFGHSWGAYSVTNVLNEHPEVKALASLAGWNKSSDIVFARGAEVIGEFFMKVELPFIELYERIKFGRIASYTSLDGFEKTKAGILITHSADDESVPIKYGYDRYFSKYSNDPRFIFVKYKDKGHNGVCNSSNTELYNKIDEMYRKYS